jgi:DNA-binding NarL/FixJ family response regulator
VAQDHPYLSPQICTPIIQTYLAEKDAGAGRTESEELTPRERTVFKLILAGRGREAISARLCLSPRTVEKAEDSLRKKLGISAIPGIPAHGTERSLRPR